MNSESQERLNRVTTLEGLLESSFSDMAANLHVIVGDGGQCLCGVYDCGPMTCGDILSMKSLDIQRGIIMANFGGTLIKSNGEPL
jgi:hypothetical protein